MPKRALALSLGIILFLCVSLGLKLAVANGARQIDDQTLARQIAGRLSAQGLDADLQDRFGNPVVEARWVGCRMLLRHARRLANRQQVYAATARPYGPLAYRWDGRWTDSPPKAWLTATTLLQEQLARLGIDTHRAPLIAVAGPVQCRDSLPSLDGLAVGTVARRMATQD